MDVLSRRSHQAVPPPSTRDPSPRDPGLPLAPGPTPAIACREGFEAAASTGLFVETLDRPSIIRSPAGSPLLTSTGNGSHEAGRGKRRLLHGTPTPIRPRLPYARGPGMYSTARSIAICNRLRIKGHALKIRFAISVLTAPELPRLARRFYRVSCVLFFVPDRLLIGQQRCCCWAASRETAPARGFGPLRQPPFADIGSSPLSLVDLLNRLSFFDDDPDQRSGGKLTDFSDPMVRARRGGSSNAWSARELDEPVPRTGVMRRTPVTSPLFFSASPWRSGARPKTWHAPSCVHE